MARTRRRRTSPKPKAGSPWVAPEQTDSEAVIETDADVNALIDKINSTMRVDMPTVELSCMTQMAVKLHDGSYRTKPLPSGAEMAFIGVRLGNRSKLIFEFKPFDPPDYAQAELSAEKVFEAFPELEATCIKALGHPDPLIADFGAAANHFLTENRTRREREARQEKKAQEKELHDTYDDNPNFGMF